MSRFSIRNITLGNILYYFGVVVVFLFFMGYTVFQARFLITGPVILLKDVPSTIQTQRLIYLEGTAENIVRLTLNGRQIYTDKDGYFKEALILENGYTIATLQVRDRYGRSRSYIQKFVYTAPEL